ncbi:MAG TPA: hypothetical protein VJA94_00035 [Candidatus Angelobacter sp.]
MKRDRVLLLIILAFLSFVAGCATNLPPRSPQPTADTFVLEGSDGILGSFTMDLSNGSVSRQQTILIPGLGYLAAADPLGRFLWVPQHDVAFKDVFVTAPPTINTYMRGVDGQFSLSDQRDYQPRIYEIAVERHGRWAYGDSSGERRTFSISPVDGHLQEVAINPPGEGTLSVLHPLKNIFYGYLVSNPFTPAQTTTFVAYAPDDATGELRPLPNVSAQGNYFVREMAFTSDGRYLIAVDFNNQVHLLAVDEDGSLTEVDTLTSAVFIGGLVPHPRLQIIYHQSGEDGVLNALRVDNGTLIEEKFPFPGQPGFLHISSNGRFLLAQDGAVSLITLDPQTGAPIGIQPVDFSFF